MSERLVVKAGMLVDGTGGAPLRRPAVVIQDGLILTVGSAEEAACFASPEAKLLDAPDLCILPGLIDAHVHLVCSASGNPLQDLLRDDDQTLLLRAAHNAQVALCAGITTVRDCGARGRTLLALRSAINADVILGARVVAAGMPITTTGGQSYWLGMEADTADEVRKAARTLAREGADFFKVMATGGNMTPGSNPRAAQYSVEELATLVAEGRRLGKRVAAHAHATAGIRNAVEAGVDALEHCSWLGSGDGLEYDEHLVDEIARRGIYVDPTLVAGYRAPKRKQDLTPARQQPLAPPECARRTESREVQRESLWEARLACYRKMIQSGVKLLAGTDAGVARTPPNSLAENLELFVHELGVSPLETIQAATQRSAQALGLNEIGTIEPGKRADLILVEGDPARDVGALRRVRWVLRDGSVVAQDGQLVVERTVNKASQA